MDPQLQAVEKGHSALPIVIELRCQPSGQSAARKPWEDIAPTLRKLAPLDERKLRLAPGAEHAFIKREANQIAYWMSAHRGGVEVRWNFLGQSQGHYVTCDPDKIEPPLPPAIKLYTVDGKTFFTPWQDEVENVALWYHAPDVDYQAIYYEPTPFPCPGSPYVLVWEGDFDTRNGIGAWVLRQAVYGPLQAV